jgi:hypothetical protein
LFYFNITSVDKSFHFTQILILSLCFYYFQACISTDNVETGDQQEEDQYQACVPTPNVDTPAKQEEKPGDCKLEVNESVTN